MARLGTLLMVLGLCALGYGVLWQLGLAPGSDVTLPQPVALGRATPGAREVSAPAGTPIPPTPRAARAEEARLPQSPPLAATTGTPTPAPAAAVQLAPADATERVENVKPPTATYAVRLAIPSIKVDTVVEQGGIVQDTHGQPVWQTLPFVAVHYGDLTSRLGVPGNAVIAGHVVTLSQGNVFRFLYQLDLGDEINVWDQLELEHDYRVVDVKLVPPSDTSVMEPTPDETLTLITCGGTFDPVKREFSDRLIVTAKPL